MRCVMYPCEEHKRHNASKVCRTSYAFVLIYAASRTCVWPDIMKVKCTPSSLAVAIRIFSKRTTCYDSLRRFEHDALINNSLMPRFLFVQKCRNPTAEKSPKSSCRIEIFSASRQLTKWPFWMECFAERSSLSKNAIMFSLECVFIT